MKRILKSTLIATSLLALTLPSLGGENVRIKLTDGSTWRGETTSLIQVTYAKHGVKRTITGRLAKVEDLYLVVESEFGEIPIFKSDLVAIRDAGLNDEQTIEHDRKANRNARSDLATSGHGATSRPGTDHASAINPDAPGVFVLPLSGQVGVEFRHEEIEKFIKEVNDFGEGQIIVLKIDSPGGFLREMPELYRAISELKRKHRVVAWVEQALSAACGVAIMCDEIYFTTEGV
ncbi:MAG: hypothetical protein O7G85_14010, partial [Planctomycetota bacterium]|nr:hypothetical protein [Planctomycetota bacterium]